MREVLAEVERWRAEGKRVAIATVVSVWGSAPRRPGSRMAVSSAGEIAGSVSGGCVEAAVVDESESVLEGRTPRLKTFGVTDEEAWAVGLSCGGTLEVFVEADDPSEVEEEIEASVREERAVAVATSLTGIFAGARLLIRTDGSTAGSLGEKGLDAVARERGAALLATGGAERIGEAGEDPEGPVFVEALLPSPRLIVVGAGHLAIPLVSLARTAGFRTAVVDPRRAFATRARFPDADALIVKWPDEAFREIGIHEATYVAVLSHDMKIDVPAIRAALESPAKYVGVLGSRRTHARRVEVLQEEGVSEAQLDRVHAPIGLDLGGRRPEEIAVAILAEMVAVRNAAPADGR